MTDLRRSLAPISEKAWAEIDAEAKRVLRLNLAARKVVDFAGPLGWAASAVGLGRTEALKKSPADGVDAAVRRVQPLVELRADFELDRQELEDIERGAKDPSLEPLVQAATQIARAEDRAIFNGYAAGSIRGICETSPHKRISVTTEYDTYPLRVAEAVNALRSAGVDGPYAIALGPKCHAGLMQPRARGGHLLIELVREILGGAAVWAPAIDGAVVVSGRGGDYELSVGQDLSIGYDSHSERAVKLYIVESFTFRVLAPEAAVVLQYK